MPKSDPVSKLVALDVERLETHGAVRFCGYVMLASKRTTAATATAKAVWDVDTTAPTFRLYTSSSFDVWLEIAKDQLLCQLDGPPEKEGQSVIWVAADAVVRRCEASTALYFSRLIEGGEGDDPAAYPRGP